MIEHQLELVSTHITGYTTLTGALFWGFSVLIVVLLSTIPCALVTLFIYALVFMHE